LKLTAQYPMDASPDRVYAALTDPAVLQRCIPGCESFTADGVDRYQATIKIGVAGLKGSYTGRAELRDREPPHRFTLAVDGKGAPGFVRATAAIGLSPVEQRTDVTCEADVQVGGLIAAVGSRLIDAVARQQMDEFFRRLREEVANGAPGL